MWLIISAEDGEVLNAVQERFLVDIQTVPDKIDPSSYMAQ